MKGKAQEGLQHLSRSGSTTSTATTSGDFRVHLRRFRRQPPAQDFLTREERRAIRQSALNEGNIPAYDSLTAEERNGWRLYISNALGKAYDEVAREDWDEVNGWEITSLVWSSLDAGLRPNEVRNARRRGGHEERGPPHPERRVLKERRELDRQSHGAYRHGAVSLAGGTRAVRTVRGYRYALADESRQSSRLQ